MSLLPHDDVGVAESDRPIAERPPSPKMLKRLVKELLPAFRKQADTAENLRQVPEENSHRLA